MTGREDGKDTKEQKGQHVVDDEGNQMEGTNNSQAWHETHCTRKTRCDLPYTDSWATSKTGYSGRRAAQDQIADITLELALLCPSSRRSIRTASPVQLGHGGHYFGLTNDQDNR